MPAFFNTVGTIIVGLAADYIAKLATKSFAEWAFLRIAQAIVDSTETDEDNTWLEAVKAAKKGDKLPE